MNLTQEELAVRWADGPGRYFVSKRDRSRLSRRRFIAASAGVAGLATSRLWFPIVARAEGDDQDHGRSSVPPRPIPQTVASGAPFHVVAPPGHGTEPSSITDFRGTIGVAAVGGTGIGIDSKGNQENLLHDVDVRFMKGEYVGTDNKRHHATFVFV